jgi:hypothetical protein
MRRALVSLTLAAFLAGSPTPFLDFLSSLWSETGCRLDPNGCPAPRTDEGCRIDPDGCPAPGADEGCHIDPNGGCLAPQRDEGCHLDPDGRCSS